MEIKFKKISMTNFKGVRERSVEFGDSVTLIQGRNKIGKTTVADAIWWVLFGKDSKGNAQFGIKTNGEGGIPIPHLDHEVELAMTVDGTDVILKRQLSEVWEHRRGYAEETLKTNQTQSFINGSRVKENEYKKYIDSLCNESLFKVLSMSDVFFGMKPADQRNLLVQMVGEKTQEEIVSEHPEFAEIIKALAVTDFDQYLSGLSYKIKQIDASINDTESRIKEQKDEVVRMKEEYGSADDTRNKIAEKDQLIKDLQKKSLEPSAEAIARKEKVESITSRINDINVKLSGKKADAVQTEQDSKTSKAGRYQENLRKRDEQKHMIDLYIRNIKEEISSEADSINSRIQNMISAARNDFSQRQNEKNAKVSQLNGEIRSIEATIEQQNRNKTYLETIAKQNLEDDMAHFRESWDHNESIRDEVSDTCPTCHQKLPEEEIERIKAEVDSKYEKEYDRLMKVADEIKARQADREKGVADCENLISSYTSKLLEAKDKMDAAMKEPLEDVNTVLSKNKTYIELVKAYQQKKQLAMSSETAILGSDSKLVEMRALEAELSKKASEILSEKTLSSEEILRSDSEYISMYTELSALEMELGNIGTVEDDDEGKKVILQEIDKVTEERDKLVSQLGFFSIIESKENRLKELMETSSKLFGEKLELEGKKAEAKAYQEFIVQDLEDRVNKLFTGIKFSMFERYLNGNMEPTCKCYIGVTDYKDGSHAERINAGLEMIDTISRYNGIYVPIVIDDAEGINQVYRTASQQIRLIVTTENTLNVIHISE